MRGPKPTKNSVTFMPARLAMMKWPNSCSMIVRIRPTTIAMVTQADGRAITSRAMPATITMPPVIAFFVSTGSVSTVSRGSFNRTSRGGSIGDGRPGALAGDPVHLQNVWDIFDVPDPHLEHLVHGLGDPQPRDLAGQEGLHGHFVGPAEGRRGAAAGPARGVGERQAGEGLEIG